jgi:putative NADPH-quinone reductase/1,4-dihydroxy-2-naphthoate octaprenyltransferase
MAARSSTDESTPLTDAAAGVNAPGRRVLVILGHPRADSFCGAIALAFGEAAEEYGLVVQTIVLAHLDFDPNVRSASVGEQPLEPDLEMARQAILQADHLVFVYPIWWGMMPALLKGFLDRILLPGFAFVERTGKQGFSGLLKGKSAQLLTTMDTPPAIVKYLLGSPGHRAFSLATLRFCGIRPVRIRMYGPVNHSTEAQRVEWLRDAQGEAARLRSGRLVSWEARRARLATWLKALRLQFYPMTWMAYTAGAALLVPLREVFSRPAYWWGYAAIFLIEAATVFLNEVFDYETDRRNTAYGPYTGGSRVVVDGEISRNALRNAAIGALGLGLVAIAVMLLHSIPPGPVVLAYLIAVVLGVGYTVPPLKFCHRGAGELVVAFTHSLLVVQIGALAMGGGLLSREVVLLSLPLFFAVLPSITLSGIPDRPADEAAGKRTLAVRFGRGGALLMALGATWATMLVTCVIALAYEFPVAVPLLAAGPLVHGAVLSWVVIRALRCPKQLQRPRLDGLMVLSLCFILWFVVLPFVRSTDQVPTVGAFGEAEEDGDRFPGQLP